MGKGSLKFVALAALVAYAVFFALVAKPPAPPPQNVAEHQLYGLVFTSTVEPGRDYVASVPTLDGCELTVKLWANASVHAMLTTPIGYEEFEAKWVNVYGPYGTGRYVQQTVEPTYGGPYILVVHDENNAPAHFVALVNEMPVDPYIVAEGEHSIGIADYGLIDRDGYLFPYALNISEVAGNITLYSLDVNGTEPPTPFGPHVASVQLNAVLVLYTADGPQELWTQNMLMLSTEPRKVVEVEDNMWNVSWPGAKLLAPDVSGAGMVTKGGFYGHALLVNRSYSLPLSAELIVATRVVNGTAVVSFGVDLGNGTVWYDNVTVSVPGLRAAYFLVSGYGFVPGGGYYDAELVLAGPGWGAGSIISNASGTMRLEYVLANGTRMLPPELFDFGSDSAEWATGASVKYVNGTAVLGPGPDSPGPLIAYPLRPNYVAMFVNPYTAVIVALLVVLGVLIKKTRDKLRAAAAMPGAVTDLRGTPG